MRRYNAGIDIGSTTTKLVVIDPDDNKIVYSEYRRHNADQLGSVISAVERFDKEYPGAMLKAALTGSGAKTVSDAIGIPFVQEVSANAIALAEEFSTIGTVIELGGQDAKIIFFEQGSGGRSAVSDMRMNGSCAGGTGAFIDEIASVLRVSAEEFNSLAEEGNTAYDISGRCGVYAKTDIQPLLNQGISRKDLALSAFHAVAKQTIGGLAQGLDIKRPVAFAGGPLHFNPVLIRVFEEMLELSDEDVLIPARPELTAAKGAALYPDSVLTDAGEFTADELKSRLYSVKDLRAFTAVKGNKPFFSSDGEKAVFIKEHPPVKYPDGSEIINNSKGKDGEIQAYLGIDSGSTTTKFVLMDEGGRVFDSFYSGNKGDPFTAARNGLIRTRDKYEKAGIKLNIKAVCTTGYGELLLNKAFSAEYHIVETVAHAVAAMKYEKDVSFILDIGGQDMKAIWVNDGIINNIVVNEACSSGCGSFLANYAGTLNVPADKIAERAFESTAPAELGSRCTVFMNSRIITEQRNGRTADDIMAGLCRSIIENVFTKVIRLSNLSSLGDKIVVQGGTFCNETGRCCGLLIRGLWEPSAQLIQQRSVWKANPFRHPL